MEVNACACMHACLSKNLSRISVELACFDLTDKRKEHGTFMEGWSCRAGVMYHLGFYGLQVIVLCQEHLLLCRLWHHFSDAMLVLYHHLVVEMTDLSCKWSQLLISTRDNCRTIHVRILVIDWCYWLHFNLISNLF